MASGSIKRSLQSVIRQYTKTATTNNKGVADLELSDQKYIISIKDNGNHKIVPFIAYNRWYACLFDVSENGTYTPISNAEQTFTAIYLNSVGGVTRKCKVTPLFLNERRCA